MLAELKVGPQINSDGTVQGARATRDGSAVVSDAHGKYHEAVVRGNCWVAALQAVQALSLNSATATGIILSNPAGSGKNLVLLEVTYAIAAAVTAVANIILSANINPVAATTVHTTPLTVRNAMLGGSGTAVGLADSAATLPVAPVIVRTLFGWNWVTGGTAAAPMYAKDQIDGALVIIPGCTISLQGLTVAHTILGSIMWEEVAI